ncbi:MAG: hypothetical protein ACRECH_18360, partial [Nitrososphaerales archaeon]
TNMGPPVYYTNQDIRKMLNLAGVNGKDIFYDLGSGYGQNIIVALTEFNVKRAVGFEVDRERLHVSRKRLKKGGLSRHASIIDDDFDDALTRERLKEATAIYYGLDSYPEIVKKIENIWKKLEPGRRLVYRHKSLFPEIMPDRADFPFYLSVTQSTSSALALFRRPKSEEEWLSKIVLQPEEMIHGLRPTPNQLWKEFTNNYDVEGIKELIEGENGIKERLKRAVKLSRAE